MALPHPAPPNLARLRLGAAGASPESRALAHDLVLARLAAGMAEAVAAFAAMMADGRLDHREKIELHRRLTQLGQEIDALRARLGDGP
jgi:hypothetical protein